MKLRRILITLLLGFVACLCTLSAGAVSDEPFEYRETATSSAYAGEHFTVRTPSDEPGILYVEGKAEIPTTAFMIAVNGQDRAYIRAFVFPDDAGEFSVRIDMTQGNKAFPTADKGVVVEDEPGGQTNTKCYNTTPGYYEVREIPDGFYRINITRATTELQAQGIYDRDCDYSWSNAANPLSGNQGFACKELVLYVEGNEPHLLHYPEITANNNAIRAADTPLESGTAAYTQYTDPYLTDLEWGMSIDDVNVPLSDEQVAYLAEAAAEITANASGDYEKALQIYRFVCQHFYYDYAAHDEGIHAYCNPFDNLYKLRSASSGSNCINGKVATTCNGYAALMIAFCRAEGIPARMVNGVQLSNSRDAWNNTEKYDGYRNRTTHWWSEVYVDGRWVVIDAQRGSGNDWRRSSWDVADDDCWQHADSISYSGFDMSEDCLSDTYFYQSVYCGGPYRRDIPAPVLRSVDTSSGYVAIEWAPVAGAEYYLISRGTDPGDLITLAYVRGDAPTSYLSLTDLEEPGTTYYYRMQARINGVYGTRSHIFSACVSQEERDGALRAPEFDLQPVDASVEIGKTAEFTVAAHNGELSYQWQYYSREKQTWYSVTNTAYEGINAATLRVPATAARDGMQFRCRVSNELFTVCSEPASLTAISAPPVIQTNPADASGVLDSTVTYTVSAAGNDLTYKWQYYSAANDAWYSTTNSVFSGGDTPTLTVTVKSWLDGASVRCRVSNPSGTVFSETAALTVKPTVSTHPKAASAWMGNTATFTVKSTGSNLSYQWQYRRGESGNWYSSTLEGCKTASLQVPATAARDGMQFRCRIKNSAGTCYSRAAALTVKQNITTQPSSKSVYGGNTAAFTVKASGSALTYRWQYYSAKNSAWYSVSGSDYSGTDTASMSVRATPGRSGMQYRCKVTNNGVTTYSDVVTLTVKNLITYQPRDAWAIPGETTGFTVYAGGADTQFQWQYRTGETGKWKNSTVSGCKTDKLSFQATLAREGYQYRCKVTNNGVTEYSEIVTLKLKRLITAQPKSTSGALGSKVQFSVTAADGSDLSYRWQYSTDGGETWKYTTLTGCKTSTLTVTVTEARNGYRYRCLVSNHGVTVTSNAARLSVSK